jgi:pseudaminic acid synthase
MNGKYLKTSAKMNSTIKIADKRIGPGRPVFIVAEISANHGQDYKKTVALIKKAKECGADAVKFQSYTPDTITIDSCSRYFKINYSKWKAKNLYRLYKKTYMPWSWLKDLKKIADDLGIIFFSSAFDKTAVDFLEDLKVPVHKIASFELIDLPLIEYMAKTKKPLIISTGMGSASEIEEAVKTAKGAGAKKVVLLKCVSTYPSSPAEANLKTISDMKERFEVPVGLSDHTLGISIPIAAVALGATVVEKHFTISRRSRTPDSFFSLEPTELKELVKSIKDVESSIGKVRYGATKGEKGNIVYRRSLFVVKDIKKGELFSEDNLRSIRPGHGLKPAFLKDIINKKAKKRISAGTPLTWKLVD